MELEKAQIISAIINSIIFILSIVGTGILIWRLKFNDKNSRLLFILYILYWMSPLLCREYTGQMHIHMKEIHDYGTLLWVPLIVYGIIGIFWRPLSDILAYKLKSRKKVIYLSLLLQVATIIPFLTEPCFTTNIIQSIGAGIGASCIGLFNLMFDDSYHHKKVFKTVAIVALPPIIAEMITSIYESFLCTFLTEGTEGRYESYHDVMRFVWVAATICILASFTVAIFVKEQKAQTIYKVESHKEPVSKTPDWIVVVLVCIAAAAVMFVRWCTIGPTATSQLIFMGYMTEVDTRFYEGYLTFNYAVGQVIGTILANVWLAKSKSKNHNEKIWLILIACVIWTLHLAMTAQYPNVPTYFFWNILNGLAMGLAWLPMTGIMLSKCFSKTKYLTPTGVFNMSLSVGICLGTFFNNWIKGPFFDFENFETKKYAYTDFVKVNKGVNVVCTFVLAGLLILMITAFIIHIKFPPKAQKVKTLSVTGETEV